MSNIGVHDFEIPHEFVQPCRDMIIIRIPVPPIVMGTSGKLIIPEQFRQIAGHNVQAGRVVAMGPMAFTYKNGNGDDISRQDVKLGDWVIIRPYAGTHLQGGKLSRNTGWRYVSSYSDVLGMAPTDKMPDPETLLWSEEDAEALLKRTAEAAGVPVPEKRNPNADFNFDAKRSPSPMFEGQ
jgi:co-chaperonin GroES (HSP10)